MKLFAAGEIFQAGDTWPVGSFAVREAPSLIPSIVENFDVPCWPELTGLGPPEELVGFWMPLFQAWERENCAIDLIEMAVKERPGLSAFLRAFSGQQLPIVKGQMIGPMTLMWALKRIRYPLIDRDRVLSFISQAFLVQGDLLAKVSHHVIISLDEPCAFMEATSERVWRELWEQNKFDPQIGMALHSCGTLKKSWFELPWNVVHVDFGELAAGFGQDEAGWEETLRAFFASGGWLALGLLSSSPLAATLQDPRELLAEVRAMFKNIGLNQILISTSCGIGDTSLPDVKNRLQQLSGLSHTFISSLSGGR